MEADEYPFVPLENDHYVLFLYPLSETGKTTEKHVFYSLDALVEAMQQLAPPQAWQSVDLHADTPGQPNADEVEWLRFVSAMRPEMDRRAENFQFKIDGARKRGRWLDAQILAHELVKLYGVIRYRQIESDRLKDKLNDAQLRALKEANYYPKEPTRPANSGLESELKAQAG